MPKKCGKIECLNSVFGGGFCKYHQYLRTDKKQTPIRKISKKRSQQNAVYLKKRIEFLNGKICPITGRQATEIHHIKGRENEMLNDDRYWLAVTREGHQKIHLNPIWAREKGYLI